MKCFLTSRDNNSLTAEVTGARKRENGLVLPCAYRARTEHLRIAENLHVELVKAKETCFFSKVSPGHPRFPWSPTFPLVTHVSLHGHPRFPAWSPTITLVTHVSLHGHPRFPAWSPTIPLVTHVSLHGHPRFPWSPTIPPGHPRFPWSPTFPLVTDVSLHGYPRFPAWLPTFPLVTHDSLHGYRILRLYFMPFSF